MDKIIQRRSFLSLLISFSKTTWFLFCLGIIVFFISLISDKYALFGIYLAIIGIIVYAQINSFYHWLKTKPTIIIKEDRIVYNKEDIYIKQITKIEQEIEPVYQQTRKYINTNIIVGWQLTTFYRLYFHKNYQKRSVRINAEHYGNFSDFAEKLASINHELHLFKIAQLREQQRQYSFDFDTHKTMLSFKDDMLHFNKTNLTSLQNKEHIIKLGIAKHPEIYIPLHEIKQLKIIFNQAMDKTQQVCNIFTIEIPNKHLILQYSYKNVNGNDKSDVVYNFLKNIIFLEHRYGLDVAITVSALCELF